MDGPKSIIVELMKRKTRVLLKRHHLRQNIYIFQLLGKVQMHKDKAIEGTNGREYLKDEWVIFRFLKKIFFIKFFMYF